MGTPKPNILVVEDDEFFRRFLDRQFADDYHLFMATTKKQAWNYFQQNAPDAVLLDLAIPEDNDLPAKKLGIELLEQMRKHDDSIPIIIITGAFKEVETVVDAMKMGAFDYLDKSLLGSDPEKLATCLKNALRQRQLQEDNLQLNRRNDYFLEQQKHKFKLVPRGEKSTVTYHFNNLVGESAAMQKVYQMIDKLGRDSNVGVLITGEAGTGKELVAASIHFNSNRKDKPMIIADLGAIATNLIASQLFGYVKGAFTDARENRAGYFEQANHSTLVLDEIADVPLEIQPTLLRAIETHKITRVGSTRPIDVNVRIITSTNKNVEEALSKKLLREDLYFRINIIRIHLPALRQRKEDIPLIVRHFLENHPAANTGKVRLENKALQRLVEYDWPGNVRELRNVVDRALVLRESSIITSEEIEALIRTEQPLFQKLAQKENVFIQDETPAEAPESVKLFSEPLPKLADVLRDYNIKSIKELDDLAVRDLVITRKFIKYRGNLQMLSFKFRITRATATKYCQQALESIFIALCRFEGNIEELAAFWQVSSENLRATLIAKHRFVKFINSLFRQFSEEKKIAQRFDVQPESLRKTIQKIQEIDPR